MSAIRFKSNARRLAYGMGILRAWHRARNRRTLTVAMFHRVLRGDDRRRVEADPLWTVSDSLFRGCLDFFAAEYNPVGLHQVVLASRGGPRLPDRALLITLDDGWSDTEDTALPLLEAAGLPSVVFVVAGAIGTGRLWQEDLRQAARRGQLKVQGCAQAGRSAASEPAVETLIDEMYDCGPDERFARLSALLPERNGELPPHMLTVSQLHRIQDSRMAIGSHGLEHIPISRLKDPAAEFRLSRARLLQLLPETAAAAPLAFSFPHGIYDGPALGAARQAGYELLFTSDACLNHADWGMHGSPAVLGRIDIPAHEVSDSSGRLSREKLACWLFLRPRRTLYP